MKTKRTLGWYFLIGAAIVTAAGLALYGNVFAKASSVRMYLLLSIAAAAAAVGASFTSYVEASNLAAGAAAILLFVGFCTSVAPMVTPIAYWYSGLYDFSTVSAYFTFAAVCAAAWILFMITCFAGIKKKA